MISHERNEQQRQDQAVSALSVETPSVEEISHSASVHELFGLYQTHMSRRTWLDMIRKVDGGGVPADRDPVEARQVAVREVEELPQVSAMQGLAASARLVRLISGWQWIDMRAAREDGASWEEIGHALGVSAESARDRYRDKIEQQEKYVGDLHDTGRARAALDDAAALRDVDDVEEDRS